MAPPSRPGKSTRCPSSCATELIVTASSAVGKDSDKPSIILLEGPKYEVTRPANAGAIQSIMKASLEYLSISRSQIHRVEASRSIRNPKNQAFVIVIFITEGQTKFINFLYAKLVGKRSKQQHRNGNYQFQIAEKLITV